FEIFMAAVLSGVDQVAGFVSLDHAVEIRNAAQSRLRDRELLLLFHDVTQDAQAEKLVRLHDFGGSFGDGSRTDDDDVLEVVSRSAAAQNEPAEKIVSRQDEHQDCNAV